MDEGNFKCDMDSNVRHPITKMERPKGRCGHDKLRAVTLVSAVLAVFAVCVSMYVMYTNDPKHGHICVLNKEDRMLLEELRSLKAKLVDHQYGNGETEQPSLSTVLQMGDIGRRLIVKREAEGATQKPPRKTKGRKKGRRKGRKGKGKKRKKKEFLAVHYVPKFWEDRSDSEFGEKRMCINVKKWGGRACRNRTLEMSDRGKMNFFHQADWVNENHHIKSPAVIKDGTFEIQESGLYLLYSSVSARVLFYDSKKKQSQAIMKNGQRLFKCMEGLDYIQAQGENTPYQSKYKTCSITGVTYLEKGDKLSVDSMYENTTIDLSEDSTFFGMVQLLPSGKQK